MRSRASVPSDLKPALLPRVGPAQTAVQALLPPPLWGRVGVGGRGVVAPLRRLFRPPPPTPPQPNLAIARVRPPNQVTEVGNSRLRLGEGRRTPSNPGPTLSSSMAARVSFAPRARLWPRWGSWTSRSWVSRRGRTATPGGRPFI